MRIIVAIVLFYGAVTFERWQRPEGVKKANKIVDTQ